MQHIVTVPSGIACFDEAIGGYPGNVFNIIETPDHRTGLLTLGHFLMAGLKRGEKCAIVTFEDPLALFQSFSSWNMDFYEYLKSEQLVFLFYQPQITTEMGLSNDYQGLIQELNHLGLGTLERVALHQVDSLLNLHSHTLINSGAHKLALAAAGVSTTFLGQYVQFHSRIYRDVRISFLKNMPGFFTLRHDHGGKDTIHPTYKLLVDRVPWFHPTRERIHLRLDKGHGFVPADQFQRGPGHAA